MTTIRLARATDGAAEKSPAKRFGFSISAISANSTTNRPPFTALIPSVHHCVIASFLTVLGRPHTGYRNDEMNTMTPHRRPPTGQARTRHPTAEQNNRDGETDEGLVSRIGSLEIDWPRSLGYFGGIAVAVGLELIDPPIGVFIAAIPFLKM